MMMARRVFLRAVLTFPAVAFLSPGVGLAQSPNDAQQFIATLAQRAITTMADKQVSQDEHNERFRALFISAFDIPEIGRFVLSRYWRAATPDQQRDFLTLFEKITVLTWAKRFRDYNGERLEAIGVTKEGDYDWVVDSHILKPQGTPIRVQWRLRQTADGGFHIVDIIVEGVSMAITLRSDYTAALQANGGQMAPLLSTLRTKIDQLRAAE